MSTSEPTNENSTDMPQADPERVDDRLLNSATIGVDVEGYDHHYHGRADAVVRYDWYSGEVERVRYLDGTPLWKWAKHVDDEIGWATLHAHGRRLIELDAERKEDE